MGALYSRMGNCDFEFGHFYQGIKTLTIAAELCDAAGNAEDTGYTYNFLVWSHLYKGDCERVLTLKENLLRTTELRFIPRWYVMGLAGASRAYICLGRWDEAVQEAQKALKFAEEFSDNSLVVFANWTLSLAYTLKSDLARSVEYGEPALLKAQTPADKARAQRGTAIRNKCQF